ncbi:MAG: hypothetical protein CR989_01000 [Flavobacteriales bacterium]|nr:MAG: hypothetical protein CR989_01000 [Flavobacteriales bacterium]
MAFRLLKCKAAFILLCCFFSVYAYSQTTEVKGTISDSENQPLPQAHISALGKETSKIITYAVSDTNGQYFLELPLGSYIFKVSYLGYKTITVEKDIRSGEILNFTLSEDATQLSEIEIKAKTLDASVKNDTTIYNLKRLTTGNEQNLNDIINKLPGVETDENGKIVAHGKKIDKLLIDGKEFFGDNHQIAGENISSEMIKGISLYENYKDLTDLDNQPQRNKTALNIEIDQAYKGKIKGNISGGGGYKSKYETEANLYSFSDKTNLFFIGNINNLGNQTFSFENYISFQGGIEKLTAKNANTTTLSSEDLPAYLFSDNRVKSKKEQLAALNFSYNPSKKFKLNSYIIFDKIAGIEKRMATQTYILENSSVEQSLENTSDNTLSIMNTFINSVYKPSSNSVLEYTLNLSPQKNEARSIDIFGKQAFDTDRKNDNFSFQQALQYKQKIASFLFSVIAFQSIKSGKEDLLLSSNKTFLGLSFPKNDFSALQKIENDENGIGLHTTLSKKISKQITAKLHYKLSATDNNFKSVIKNKTHSNNISTSVFEQQLGFFMLDKSGLFQYEIGGNYSFFNFKHSKRTELLPYANFKLQFKKSHTLSIYYDKSIKIAHAKNIVEEPYIANFNTLLNGSGLSLGDYAIVNQLGFRYFIYDLFSGTLLSLGSNLSYGKDNLATNTLPKDGYRINTFIKGTQSKNLNGYLLMDKKFTKIPFSLRLKTTYSQLKRFNYVNYSPTRILTNNWSNTIKISSNIKNSIFNFESGFRYYLSRITTNIQSKSNKVTQTEPFLNIFLNSRQFFFGIDNSLKTYKTGKNSNTFYRLNPEVRYSSKNGKWKWYLKGNDILHLDKNKIIENAAYENFYEEETVSVLSGYVVTGLEYKF